MEVVIKFGKRRIVVRNVEKCKGVKKFVGLMFKKRENANAILFEFEKPTRTSIHSFFCPCFVALWINDKGEIMEYEFVKPNRIINPKKKFVELLEVPSNKKYKHVPRFFSLEMEKFKK